MSEEKRTIKSRYANWKATQGKEGRIGLALFIIINAVAFTSGYWWAVLLMIAIDALLVWKLYGAKIKAYREKQRLLKIEKSKAYLKKQGVKKL